MRVLLLAALAATGYAAACDPTCVGAIFTEMVGAEAMGFSDEDAATYGYLLWHGWNEAGANGLAWVKSAVEWTGGADACNCLDACTAAKITTCFNDATAETVTDIDDGITAYSGEGSSDELKAAFRSILGVLANQIAPGSEPAKKWTETLTDDEMTNAIKVYNIVGAWVHYVEPTLNAAFAGKDADKTACMEQIWTAIGYSAGDDLAVAIATKGEEAFGADGLKHALCFGEGSPAATEFTVTFVGDTSATTFDADNTVVSALDAEKTKADDAVAAQLKATVGTKTDDTTSPAAALSAVVAVIAMML